MQIKMAHKLIKSAKKLEMRKPKQVVQKFKYLLVTDFEATCERDEPMDPQEIIEFPCIALSTRNWEVTNVFHEYVKPRVHSTLTPFCTDLTGIMQEMVQDRPHFPEVFAKFNKWLEEGGYLKDKNESAFVTCGNCDLRVMLPKQCELDGLQVPDHFKEWIDLKHVYCETTRYYPRSLRDMLVRLNISQVGRMHSGINDVRNMIAIIKALNDTYNAMFNITSTLNPVLKVP